MSTVKQMIKYKWDIGQQAWFLHIISGLVLVLYSAFHIFFLFVVSLGEEMYRTWISVFKSPFMGVFEIIVITLMLYHMCNGIRILIFDIGWGIGIASHKVIYFLAMVSVIVFLFFHILPLILYLIF